MARLTWQVSPRNKLGVYMDRIHKVRGAAMSPGYDQTTASVRWNSPLYMTNSIKWSSTVSNKLLIEGGYSSNIERYNNLYAPGVEQQVPARPHGSPTRRTTTASSAPSGSPPRTRAVSILTGTTRRRPRPT